MINLKEIFRDIKGYEGLYQISNYGRVRSFPKNRNGYKEVILKQRPNVDGYLHVCLGRKTTYIHALVAKAFIENPENKEQINHRDGNKTNNHVKNLEWVTAKENQQHAKRLGLRADGERSGASKLRKSDVVLIKKLLLDRNDIKVISNFFNVSQYTIRDIKINRYWKNV